MNQYVSGHSSEQTSTYLATQVAYAVTSLDVATQVNLGIYVLLWLQAFARVPRKVIIKK